MIRFLFFFCALMGLFVLMVVGLTNGIPSLMLAWMCLSVPVALMAGRASVRAIPGVALRFERTSYQDRGRRRSTRG
jgi:formylmethanofuran:tetrahydromethanopterin formyltransferase